MFLQKFWDIAAITRLSSSASRTTCNILYHLNPKHSTAITKPIPWPKSAYNLSGLSKCSLWPWEMKTMWEEFGLNNQYIHYSFHFCNDLKESLTQPLLDKEALQRLKVLFRTLDYEVLCIDFLEWYT